MCRFLTMLILVMYSSVVYSQTVDIADQYFFYSITNMQDHFVLDSVDANGNHRYSCRFRNSRSKDKVILIRLDTLDNYQLWVDSQRQTKTTSKGAFVFFAIEIERDKETVVTVSTYASPDDLRVRFYDQTFLLHPILYSLGVESWCNTFLIIGGLIFILMSCIIYGFGFVLTKDRDYGYYMLYLLVMVIYFYNAFVARILVGWVDDVQPNNVDLIHMAIQPLFHTTYVLFVRSFLKSKQKYPVFDKVVRYFIVLAVCSSVALCLLNSYSTYAAAIYFHVYRVTAIGISIYLITYVARQQDPLAIYIVWGSAIFVGFATIAMLMSWVNYTSEMLGPMHYTLIGTLIEIACFSFGLAHKGTLIGKEKLKLEVAYNRELTRNTELLTASELKLKTVVEDLKESLHQEQEVRVASVIANKDLEQEIANLRMQLNPHFVFNALTSLKSFVLNKDRKAASQHIDELSFFMRNVLTEAPKSTISLSLMLRHIRNYVAIENKRLAQPIQLEISVDTALDSDLELVPSMLLQPFVENAIWHGLAPSSASDKLIRIDVQSSADFLTIVIEDNGVGRVASSQKSSDRKNGVAIQLLSKRIALHNEGVPGLDIHDLYSEDGQPIGTRVRIRVARTD